jgi:hypothetical protein
MNIDNSLIKMQGNHHYRQYENSIDAANQGQVSSRRDLRPQEDSDQLKLSDAAKATKTEKTDVDLEKSLKAGDFLNLQIISQMVKRVTGQDLQLTLPTDLQDQVGGISFQAPQPPPSTPGKLVDGQTYQQSLSYFEAQSITFNAEGTISTKDGQNVKFSVSLSMSHLFYSQENVNAASGDANTDKPLQVSYSGMAAELTTTSFKFSIDSKGSLDQVATSPKPAIADPASAHNASDKPVKEVKNDTADDKMHKATAKQNDSLESIFDGFKSFISALRIWQHHADGSQQLLALGEQSIGAVFLGHVTKPLAAEPKAGALPGVFSNGSIVVPEPTKPSTAAQINITA